MAYHHACFQILLLGIMLTNMHFISALPDSKNQAELTKLFNSNVKKAEYVTRPMSSSDGQKHIPLVHHAGVRLTLNNGDQYLLHKGSDYGKSSDTVITPASNMKQSNWKTLKSAPVHGKTVNDFMQNALPDKKYNIWIGDHCQTAAHKAFSISNPASKPRMINGQYPLRHSLTAADKAFSISNPASKPRMINGQYPLRH